MAFFEQLVVESTRGKVFFVLVLCNDLGLVRQIRVNASLGGNNPNMIECQLQFEREKLNADISVLLLSKEADA